MIFKFIFLQYTAEITLLYRAREFIITIIYYQLTIARDVIESTRGWKN